WYFTSGNRQAAPHGDLAPDIEGPATLGPALDSRDVLEGVFRHSFFAEPLDGDTGLAVGYDVFPEWAFSSTIVIGRGMEGEIVVDPETGGVETVFEAPEGLSGSRAAVAGFDLDTGERKWQVDLRAAAGESSEAEVWYAAAWPDGLGNAVAEVHVGPTEDRVLLAIDGQTGEVFSQGEFLASPTACFMGIQLTEDNGGPVPRVAAYRVDNLGSPLWTAESGGRAPLAHTASGTFWVSTADGYVEAATGRRVGFDEPGGHTFYRLRAGGKDLVLLGREMNGRVIRVDPATGAELWATEMPEYQMDEWTVAAPAVVQQFQENGVPGLVAVDIQTGAELWSGDGLMQPIPLNGDPLPAESAILVRQSDGSLAGVDVRDGSVLAQLGDLGDCAVADQGPTVVYLACGRSGPVRYRALSLVRDGDPLWEVRPEGAAALAEASLRSAYGRMWVDVAVNGEDPSVEDHMVRYEIVG
ncbi:MAG: PQQ-binding-like beta-propeller repeat protein, partial [Bifidobacteriaceae bacterium]|nr:PQQ-binding-like beta-propeller repeat protein [Bifidobacteriaceae bacterium]